MLRKTFATFLTIAALCLVNATAAQGATINIVNSDSGWYDDSGEHDPTNTNYIAGAFGGVAFNNFFVFDLSSLAGQTVLSAQLQVFAYEISANGIYANFDVLTPVPTLTAGGSGMVATHVDLASGAFFGGKFVTPGDSDSLVTITLNAAAIAAIQANAGGLWAIGGDFLGDGGSVDYIFGFSEFDVQNQLIVETAAAVPDGGIAVSLLGGALMALGVLRRKFNA